MLKIPQSLRDALLVVAAGKNLERQYGYNAAIRIRHDLRESGLATFPGLSEEGHFRGTLTPTGKEVVKQEKTPLGSKWSLSRIRVDREGYIKKGHYNAGQYASGEGLLFNVSLDPDYLREQLVKAGIDQAFTEQCLTPDLPHRLRDEYGAAARATEVSKMFEQEGRIRANGRKEAANELRKKFPGAKVR